MFFTAIFAGADRSRNGTRSRFLDLDSRPRSFRSTEGKLWARKPSGPTACPATALVDTAIVGCPTPPGFAVQSPIPGGTLARQPPGRFRPGSAVNGRTQGAVADQRSFRLQEDIQAGPGHRLAVRLRGEAEEEGLVAVLGLRQLGVEAAERALG